MEIYYSKNANEFIKDTFNSDLSFQYSIFLKNMKSKSKILDLGCGSGRDSLAFNSKGYIVYAMDPEKQFCDNAKKIGIDNVFQSDVQHMSFYNFFDGIWACASLLHVPKEELNYAFIKCSNALKLNGYMYASFKYGDYIGFRDGRFFIDLTEKSINEYLKNTNFEIIELFITNDVRPEKKGKWLNLILKKTIIEE